MKTREYVDLPNTLPAEFLVFLAHAPESKSLIWAVTSLYTMFTGEKHSDALRSVVELEAEVEKSGFVVMSLQELARRLEPAGEAVVSIGLVGFQSLTGSAIPKMDEGVLSCFVEDTCCWELRSADPILLEKVVSSLLDFFKTTLNTDQELAME